MASPPPTHELIARPEVDYVLRGDSTEQPLLQLMDAISKGFPSRHTQPDLEGRGRGARQPLSYVPEDLGSFSVDYGYVMHSVVRYLDLGESLPGLDGLPHHHCAHLQGCSNTCNTCGGSAFTSRRFYGRQRPTIATLPTWRTCAASPSSATARVRAR